MSRIARLIAARMIGGGISYLLRDLFTTTLAAGAVNGTAAEPGPGTRAVVDTNTKISIASGALTFATGAAANDALWEDTLFSRVTGRTLLARVTRPDALGQIMIGWDGDKTATGFITCCVFFAATNLYIAANTGQIILGAAAATTYDVAVVMRPFGMFYFIKGGAFTNWTLLWVSLLSNTARYPGFMVRTTSSPFTADYIKVPTAPVSICPQVYDTFTTGNLTDNFTRADGAIGTALSGQSWAQVPAGDVTGCVEATISSNQLVAADSGEATTAAYSGIDLGAGRVPTRMAAKIIFSEGTINGAAALISNQTGLAHVSNITAGSVHIVFTSNYCDIAYWDGSVYTRSKTYTYPTPCAKDGATEYDIAWSIDGNTITIEAPDGTTTTDTNEAFGRLNGRYCTFEHYWATGQCQPSFTQATITANTSDTTSYDGWTILAKTWTDQAGTFGRATNTAKAVALSVGGIAITTTPANSADVIAEVVPTRAAGTCGLILRYTDADNYIKGILDGTNMKVIEVVTGTPNELLTGAVTYGATKRMVVIAAGNKVRGFYGETWLGAGAEVTTAITTGTAHGLFTDDLDATFDGFAVWARGSAGEYEGLLNKYIA